MEEELDTYEVEMRATAYGWITVSARDRDHAFEVANELGMCIGDVTELYDQEPKRVQFFQKGVI